MAPHPRDDLYDWLTRTAPDFLRDLADDWSDPRTAFDAYLRTGDADGFFAFNYRGARGGSYREATEGSYRGATGYWRLRYRDGTGRLLPIDMVEHLRRYFAERGSGTTRLCWVSEDPSDDTLWPIGAIQLQTMLSALPTLPTADGAELAAALKPLLVGIAQGTLTFGDKPHRVIVVTRQGPWLTREEAIAAVHRRGVWVGRGGVSENEFCKQVVEAAGVARGDPGFSDVSILRDARKAQSNRG